MSEYNQSGPQQPEQPWQGPSAGKAPGHLPPGYWPYPMPPRRRSRVLPIILGILLMLSVLMNVLLLAAVGVLASASSADAAFTTTTISDGDSNQTIALYRVSGMIEENASRDFAAFANEVLGSSGVKAVVLRIDSPGGTVAASDQIHAQVKRIQATGKKVIVSMGGMATSGAYYISAPADEIYAEPTTITGSIGVIMSWLVVEGTLDKLGVQSVVLKSAAATAWKDELSPFDMPSEYQRQHLQGLLDDMQKQFENVVRSGRGSKLKTRNNQVTLTAPSTGQAREITEIEPLNGKVYMAQEAMNDYGLVDAIGYESDALARAGTLANLSRPRVVRYDRSKGLLETVLTGPSSGAVVDQKLIDSVSTPRIMMLWKVQ